MGVRARDALLPLIASFEDENDAVEEIMDSPIVNGKIDVKYCMS